MNPSDPKIAAALNQAIREDAGAWFEIHGKIYPKDKSKGLIKPRQNRLQSRIQKVIHRMDMLGLPIRLIGLKPRQKGSTTYFCAIDYCKLRREPTSGVIIGGQYAQTKEAWSMMETYSKSDSFDWGNTGEVNTKEGKWTNASRLKQETANDKLAGVAGTYQLLHCTEVARWKKYGVANAEEVLSNLLKCVPLEKDTIVILESTAEGASGAFYKKWMESADMEQFISGEVDLLPGSYVRVFAAWFEFDDSTIRLTEKQKRHIERTLDNDPEFEGEKALIDKYGQYDEQGVMRLGNYVTDFDVWEQLAWRRYEIHENCDRDKNIFDRDYPHCWEVAFQKSGSVRFNQTGLAVLKKRLMAKPNHGIIEETVDKHLNFRNTDISESQHTIFEFPKPGHRYIMPIDVMTGASQVSGKDPDSHAVFVIREGFWDGQGRWNRPCTAARVIPCRWDIDVLFKAVWPLARFYGGRTGCLIAIEMNMDRGLTELLKQVSANLYRRQIFNQVEQKFSPAYGYQTNVKTRETLIEKLAKSIREWDTPGDGVDIFCPHAIEQCENFIRDESGHSEAAQGHHDDDVISIALGLELIGNATTYYPMRFENGVPPDLRDRQDNSYPGAYS